MEFVVPNIAGGFSPLYSALWLPGEVGSLRGGNETGARTLEGGGVPCVYKIAQWDRSRASGSAFYENAGFRRVDEMVA